MGGWQEFELPAVSSQVPKNHGGGDPKPCQPAPLAAPTAPYPWHSAAVLGGDEGEEVLSRCPLSSAKAPCPPAQPSSIPVCLCWKFQVVLKAAS